MNWEPESLDKPNEIAKNIQVVRNMQENSLESITHYDEDSMDCGNTSWDRKLLQSSNLQKHNRNDIKTMSSNKESIRTSSPSTQKIKDVQFPLFCCFGVR